MNCASCGAPLVYTEEPVQVCDHCGLANENLSPVMIIDDTALKNQADNFLKRELERLEQLWMETQNSFLERNWVGNFQLPQEQYLVHQVFLVISGMSGFAMCGLFWLLGFHILGVFCFVLIPFCTFVPLAHLAEKAKKRYEEYRAAESEYHARKNRIVEQYNRMLEE